MKKINIKDVTACPWNTRGEITTESVKGLAKSIEENDGRLICPISIWEHDGEYVCIAGNRRLAALKLLGRNELVEGKDFVMFPGTADDARLATITENLQREAVNAIAEAERIGEYIDEGMKPGEIAAKLGKSESWVRRRAKLTTIDATLAAKVKECPSRFTVQALERVAALTDAAQKKLAKTISDKLGWSEDWKCTTETIRYDIWRETSDLDEAQFDTSRCAKCENCSAAQGDLFGAEEGNLGRCMNPKCYTKKTNEHEDALVKEAVGDAEVVRLKYAWEAPKEANGEKRDKKHPCAYVFVYNGEVTVKWGPSKKELDEAKEREEAERRERDAERRADNERNSRIREALNDATQADEDDNYPAGIIGGITKYLAKDAPQVVAEKIASIVADWIAQWHDDGDWAEIASVFDFVPKLAEVGDEDLEWFINRNKED